jgi:ribonuclease-3
VQLRNPLRDIYLTRISSHRDLYKSISAITGSVPRNISCYKQALRHHSVSATVHENGYKDSNERLEYLGDSVLNTIVAEVLFRKYPYKNEGFLTEMRAKIVSRESLNDLALKIGLKELLQYDKRILGPQVRNTIFGNALEAFVGAIYLDTGFAGVRKFILDKLIIHIDLEKLQHTETNFKGKLIEWAHKNTRTLEFETDELIQAKQKIYKVRILIDKEMLAESENLSKKKAEQFAAQKVFETLKIIP